MKLTTVRKLNKSIRISSATIAFVIITVLALSGGLYAKYVREFSFNGKLTISVDLAESFSLYEHQVAQNSDGTFIKSDGARVVSNTYYVVPGIDIPKDPTIEIKGKTKIPALLYIEVIDGVDHKEIDFSLESHWVLLEGVQGAHEGAKVYVYATGGKDGRPIVLDNNTNPDSISNIEILTENQEGNTLSVSSRAKYGSDISLVFYAHLVQIDDKYKENASYTNAIDLFNNFRTKITSVPAESE